METPKENWREEFEEMEKNHGWIPEHKERMIAFIEKTLLTQRQEIAETIDGRKKAPILCGNCNFQGDLCIRCYANRQVNKELSDLSERIEKGA